MGETDEAPVDEQNEDLDGDTITPDIEEEAGSGDDMQEEAPAVDEEEPTEPVEEEDAVNAPMNVEAYKLTVADVVAPTGDGFTYKPGENANVENDGFTFTVEAAENYAVTSVQYKVGDGEPADAVAGSDNAYTIPKEVFTDTDVAEGAKVQILVTATRIQYTVTPTVKVGDKTLAADEYATDETVDFSWKAATDGADAGKVYAGDNLTFTAKLKQGKDAEYSIAVSYTVADGDEVKPAITNNGVYTISKVSGNVAINVTVAPLKQCVITVADNAGIKEFTYLKDGKYVAYDKDERPTVTENQDFSFKVTPATYYKIDKVTVAGTVVTAKNGVYTAKITDDTNITVETSIDAKQCNTLTFALDKTSDLKSAKATVVSISANDVDSDIDNQVGSVIEAGGTLTFPGDAVTLKIEPKNGYTITKVNGSTDITPDAEGAVAYKVNKFASKKATVTVTTDTKESVSENALVTFEMNNAPKLSYKVTGDKIDPVEGAADQYQTSKDTKRLKFTITATGSYLPIVTQATITTEGGTAGAAVPVEASKTTATKTGATYDYVIPVSQLGYGATFAITQKDDSRTVTIGGEGADNVTVLASINGMKRNPDTGKTKEYTVLLNDVVTLQIKAGTNSDLTEVVSKVGTKETKAKITNNTATLEVKVTDNTEINITTKDQYVASKLTQVKGTEKTELDPVGATNSYNVAYDGKYEASVAKGASLTDVELSDVRVLQGKNTVAPAEGKPAVGSITDKVATIDLNNADTTAIAGKTLTVELYAKEGTGEDVKVATYSLIVSAPAKDIKINKSANLTVNQAIDTTKTYTVTAAKGVDLNTLEAKSDDTTNSIISDMDYANGILNVTLAAKLPADAKATITIAAKGAAETDPNKATIVITPVKLIADNAKAPTVKLIAATDVSFKLALSAKTEEAVSKNLYYKVVTSTETVSDNDVTVKSEKITYVPKTGDSQNAIVYVSDKTTLGSGDVGTYMVTASVVHANKKVGENETLEEADTLGTSAASKAQTLKTQKPAYEDKLKLQKGKTTVVTGETNVVIAKPQFNKYTTYATLDAVDAVKDITAGLSDTQKLTVKATEDALGNYEIMASANVNTWVGKHKIQVTASAEGGAYASVATIDVTVVRGIHYLKASVPSTNLYKVNKKPAKVKATAVYNEGWTGTWVPKNKKVKWDIVAYDYSELAANDPLKTMVTAKNGTVTVDKNFIIDPDDSTQNQFRIRVTADNDKSFAGANNGTPIVGYSEVITISNTGEDIKTLAIVKETDWEENDGVYTCSEYTVTALPTGTKDACDVPASDIHYCKVVAFTSAAPGLTKGKTYTPADIALYSIDPYNLTIKSSNQKAVPVYANGSLGEVSKIGKVKLTATANDGSKNKAELSLNITSDKTTGALSLKITPALYEHDAYSKWAVIDWDATAIYDPQNPGDKKIEDLRYDASTTPLIAVQVQENNNGSYNTAPMFVNAQLSVSKGAKIVDKWQNNTAFIAITAPEVTVTLKDVTNNKTENFVIKSNGATAKAAKITATKLRSVGKVSEQKAKVELTGLPEATLAQTDLYAKVEVDWSAANAKNTADLIYLADNLDDKFTVTSESGKGTFTLGFKGTADSTIKLNQKSYKLTVTLGYDDNSVFKALTVPASMTVSVDKAKAFTFTPMTSYTLTTRDTKASAELKAKACSIKLGDADDSEGTVTYSKLENLNTKGVTNKFTTYFQISSDGKRIELKGNTIPAKADLTGYLYYTTKLKVGYYTEGKGTGTDVAVKITIKVDDKKTAAKYAQTKNEQVTIGNIKGQKATVTITSQTGKAAAVKADLAAVVVDPKDTKSAGFVAETTDAAGEVQLTWNGDAELKKNNPYTVKLLIVPTTSHYKDALDGKSGDELNSLIAQYGVPVSVKVKAGDPVTPMGTAKAKLTKWLGELGESNIWLRETVTNAGFLTKAQAAVGDAATVAIAKKEDNTTEDLVITLATLTTAGSVKGNLVLTIAGEDEPGTVEVNVTIPAGAVTAAVAKAAIEDADGAVKKLEITNADIADDKKADIAKKICDEAQEMLGDKYYTVTVKDPGLTGTAAEAGTAGNASITLVITEKGEDAPAGTEVTITYTIAALPTE